MACPLAEGYYPGMAITILGKSQCPLCDKVLQSGDDIIGTPHFIHSGPLHRYSDAGMHRGCFTAWSKAGEFIAAFNEFGRSFPRGPRQMLKDGSIVEVNPDELPPREEGKPRVTVGILGEGEERDLLLAAMDAVTRRTR
jgi:hypothetical protein